MRTFLLLAALGLCRAQQLYEEPREASMPQRERQWKQLQAYAASLTAGEAAYSAEVEPLRQTLRSRLGYPPPGLFARVTARMEKFGEDATATYYRCYIPISPEMETYGLYLVPKNLTGRAPLVIAQHGGAGYPELATFNGGSNYHDMVRGAVARGYVVFAPLHIFYPTSDKEHGTPIPPDVRALLDQPLRARHTSLMAVEIAKISKALDALLERPEIDPARVAMIGLSWGGYYTQYTTALEPRIRVAVSSCAYYEPPATAPAQPVYGRPDAMTTAELIRLVCPRPIQMQYGERDPLIKIEPARRGLAESGRPFQNLKLGDHFEFHAFDGVHEFRGDLAWPFLKKFL